MLACAVCRVDGVAAMAYELHAGLRTPEKTRGVRRIGEGERDAPRRAREEVRNTDTLRSLGILLHVQPHALNIIKRLIGRQVADHGPI